MGIDLDAFHAAERGDLKQCQELVNNGANINCVLMGASPRQARTSEQKRVCDWALINGACLTFGFWHQHTPFITLAERFENQVPTRVFMDC